MKASFHVDLLINKSDLHKRPPELFYKYNILILITHDQEWGQPIDIQNLKVWEAEALVHTASQQPCSISAILPKIESPGCRLLHRWHEDTSSNLALSVNAQQET